MRIQKQYRLGLLIFLLSGIALITAKAQSWQMQKAPLQTRWSKQVLPDKVLPEYPRPQMVRKDWQNLNGLWNYAFTAVSAGVPKDFNGSILVPFPVESALSGVMKPLKPDQTLWYRRSFDIKGKPARQHYLLHFGAVDFSATVSVNGQEVGKHKGGYQEFTFDISKAIHEGRNELTVEVRDPTEEGNNPKGKQVLHPQGIMYTAVSGIWQTVWLETVAETYIASLKMTPDIDKEQLGLTVKLDQPAKDYAIEVETAGGSKIYPGNTNSEYNFLTVPVAGPHLWSPQDPFLYDIAIRIKRGNKTLDEVKSYFGMRKIEIRKDSLGQDRIFLNNRYCFNLGVLDQGYWPDGLYTAPTDEALKWDIAAIRSMGFNMIRKHIKIEPARWYYHCDKLGMLVWQDMPFPANGSNEAKEEFEDENIANIEQLYNYPSIICWVLFNEGWNSYDQEKLTRWAKRKDPSRLVNGHTGENYCRTCAQEPGKKWASSDLTDIHVYPGPGLPPSIPGKALSLGEWGGVRVATPDHHWDTSGGWGYIQTTKNQFEKSYSLMIRHLKLYEEEGLSASVYTQPFDVETEENGLITYDREVFKMPLERIREINSILNSNH